MNSAAEAAEDATQVTGGDVPEARGEHSVPAGQHTTDLQEADVTQAVAAEPEEAAPRSSRLSVDRERTRELFIELQGAPEGDPRKQRARDSLVEQHLPLVEHLARRFRNRGEPYDDLVQVATIGLIKAVDRFDPDHG